MPVEIGEEAPDFELRGSTGEPVRLARDADRYPEALAKLG